MKKVRYHKLRMIVLTIAAAAVSICPHYGNQDGICRTGLVAEASASEKITVVLKTEIIRYRQEPLIKASVRMDTADAGIEAYSIYLDYDQKAFKPMAIYGDDGGYDENYYQYEGVGGTPMVNFTDGNVNAQYASLSSPVNKAGSVLLIAYFEIKEKGNSPARISIMEKSSFAGSNDDYSNKTITLDSDSVTSVKVDLDDSKASHGSSGSSEKSPEKDQGSKTEENSQSAEDKKSTEDKNTGSKGTESKDTGSKGTESKKTESKDTGSKNTESKDTGSKNTESKDTESKDIESEEKEDSKSQEKEGQAAETQEEESAENTKAKIRLNKTKVTMKAGRTLKLKVKNTKKKITWSSGNKKIASVNKKGKVTAKRKGNTVIKAKVKGGKVLKCKVKVKK